MYEGIIQDLIDELGRLPGVGPKSAQRIAFHIIASDMLPQVVQNLTRSLTVFKTSVRRVTSTRSVAISLRRIYAGYAGIQGGITHLFV